MICQRCGNIMRKGGIIQTYATNGKPVRVYFCQGCGFRATEDEKK